MRLSRSPSCRICQFRASHETAWRAMIDSGDGSLRFDWRQMMAVSPGSTPPPGLSSISSYRFPAQDAPSTTASSPGSPGDIEHALRGLWKVPALPPPQGFQTATALNDADSLPVQKHHRRICLGALICAGLLSSCTTVGPDYTAPDSDRYVSTDFAKAAPYDDAAPLSDWWTAFEDPVLESLIKRGFEENRTLAAATANLRLARADLGLAQRARLPDDTLEASYLETRQSSAAFTGIADDAPPGTETFGIPSLSVAAGWEVDLFGRVDRLIEAADARAGAAEAALADMQIVIATDIAAAYLSVRGLRDQRDVARRNVENLRETSDLVRDLRDVGRVSDLELDQAHAELALTEAFLPALNASITDAENRLAVLIGATPQEIGAYLADDSPLAMIKAPIAIGDPAALLRRRPDIAERERLLAAATAGIGLNIAEAFPRISLLGEAGVRSVGIDDLLSERALNFAAGPQLAWSVTGLIRAGDRVRAARASADAAFAMYEQTVLQALAETETALERQSQLQARSTRLEEAHAAATSAAALATFRFETGTADFLNVLDAERVELDTANQLAAARSEVALAQVAVFRVLRAGAPSPVAPSDR
ncbi:putative outer membrane efflux protein [Hyphomonas neptunium ATCC 15444]|uniref:Putative outer membrane efflux protein n=3 Tax=Hyphomonadaceae TaxID=69657 RepID=Q0C060_HYPNA|nr:putative outer membrane efflux protein [Hyphomonas neptunium ATCC 15444]